MTMISTAMAKREARSRTSIAQRVLLFLSVSEAVPVDLVVSGGLAAGAVVAVVVLALVLHRVAAISSQS
jgi:hypothetical protein